MEAQAQLFVLLQRLLPQHLLTALVRRLARVRLTPLKNLLIRRFVRWYDVNVEEAARPVPDGYADFNAFFTRELADGAREIDSAPDALVSPVDGITSAVGTIDRGRLLQAKGVHYSLVDLLATDLDDAVMFAGGTFATFYLAPNNYHRVHSPLAAELAAARYVPGHLFSVNRSTVQALPGLFTRNERLVCHFRTASGPLALVFVGALNVGSISTRWTGTIRPRRSGVVEELALDAHDVPTAVAKGGLLGWFNMGSTVIVLLPPDRCEWRDDLRAGTEVRMGQAIGRLLSLPEALPESGTRRLHA